MRCVIPTWLLCRLYRLVWYTPAFKIIHWWQGLAKKSLHDTHNCLCDRVSTLCDSYSDSIIRTDIHADGAIAQRWQKWITRLENLFVAAAISDRRDSKLFYCSMPERKYPKSLMLYSTLVKILKWLKRSSTRTLTPRRMWNLRSSHLSTQGKTQMKRWICITPACESWQLPVNLLSLTRKLNLK